MKRNEHVNDLPDIEIVDLENETVQDTDFGKSDISDDFEGNPDDEYEENDREEEEEEHHYVDTEPYQYVFKKIDRHL